jgi:hypothetical protein
MSGMPRHSGVAGEIKAIPHRRQVRDRLYPDRTPRWWPFRRRHQPWETPSHVR